MRRNGNTDVLYRNLCSLIEEFDPEFIFLPAYYIAKRTMERMKDGRGKNEVFNEVCEELKICSNGRGKKILKVAEKILNSNNF
ncbi:MAG: hypothetical protein NT136_04300 [Candidatus Moranbacteria bacterium]|nr:hypothetical protein [Candidatus Moranbacteria bacterium]